MKTKKKTLEQRIADLETEVMLLKAQRIQIIHYPVYSQNPPQPPYHWNPNYPIGTC